MQTIRIQLNIHHCYISYVKKKIKALKAKTPQKKITVNRYLLTPQQNIVFFNIMKCYLLLKQQILFSAKERAKCFFFVVPSTRSVLEIKPFRPKNSKETAHALNV